MNVNNKISKLRKLMDEKGIDAYIIPTYDAHQSEYVGEHWQSRVWISGFTGSAGTVVVTKDEAGLWTDGRYFIQAENQLKGSEIKLFKMGIPGYPTYIEWIKDNLEKGETLGFDGKVFPQSDVESMSEELSNKGIKFVEEYDLIDEIWTDRPELPMDEIFIHDAKYTGKTPEEKLEDVRKEMKKLEVEYYILGSLDDIAWVYNVRGKDVKYNPVVTSYAFISMDKAYLFIHKTKVPEEVEEFLNENGIEIREYEEVRNYVENIEKGSRVFIDPSKVNRWLYNGIPKECKVVGGTNITTNLKAIKNSVEIKNLKNSYVKDGVALVKFLYWLDKNLGKTTISEISVADKLEEFRSEQEDFVEPSFATIAAYKDHAPMMHYSATEDSDYTLEKEGMLLIDSGGQYLDGTTDITRTIILGPITEEEKKDFTLTLKGHINLIKARFLYGATGSNLDVLARFPLWQEGIDYKCGTGHGVGFFLNVHEGPHRFAPIPNKVRLEEGMVITIEPGVYKEGKHGIRIENDIVVRKDIVTESGQFMKFETISYCPIDLEGVDVELLDEDERQWLNNYHSEVYEKLSPYLNEDEKEWLKNETRNI
ncbi:aminopeptidase P family protein [Anaerosalibacter massiliensis]|uniref:Aminopeptidase P family protein n=1 Tax=Anaerosalibacter massiliensis TaxID=1347392 RepID=A0A9X2S4X2_9FIRM|nr:aminopeptidase P family protein [Anaerosalibacter massiliensis]MCR2043933.1 aminopeptidase P family protein [Anaerosalibacter massiliensis]